MYKQKIKTKLCKILKGNRGITLIALVITIIVLLILAGVTITTLIGENGILDKAKTSEEQTKKAIAYEKVEIAILGSYNKNTVLDKDLLINNLKKAGGIIEEEEWPIIVIMDGYVFEIDSKNLGLIIDYHITDWYVNEGHYLEKSLLYNSVSIFALIDNVEQITFNFSGNTYIVSRKQINELYPNFKDIVNNGINQNNFNKYLESKINDNNFVEDTFKKIFVN